LFKPAKDHRSLAILDAVDDDKVELLFFDRFIKKVERTDIIIDDLIECYRVNSIIFITRRRNTLVELQIFLIEKDTILKKLGGDIGMTCEPDEPNYWTFHEAAFDINSDEFEIGKVGHRDTTSYFSRHKFSKVELYSNKDYWALGI